MSLRIKISKLLLKYWPIIIITFISFILPAIWFKDGLGIGYIETGLMYLIEPSKLLNFSIYTWSDFTGLGSLNPSLQPATFFLVTSFLRLLGLPLVAIQYLTFASILIISALAMYFVSKELFKNYSNSNLISLFSALFYILNPYTMNVWHRFVSSIFCLPLLPLIFLITVKLFKKPSFKYSLLFAVTILVFSISAAGPHFFIAILIPPIFYTLFEIIRIKDLRLMKLKYIGIGIMLTVLLNIWWIMQSIISVKQIYSAVGSPTLSTNIGALNVVSKYYTILNISKLLNASNIPWYGLNYNPGWIEFLIPALALIAVLFYLKNKNILFLSILIIIGIFLGKGLQPPGGKIFEWLFLNIPGFAMFSLLLVISVWPMWTGDVFSFSRTGVPLECKFIPTTKVAIPEYWREAADYINKDRTDNHLAFLPQAQFDETTYKWEYGYHGNDVTSVNSLFNNPVISKPLIGSYSENYRKFVLDENFFKEQKIIPQLFSYLNLKYILVRNDISPVTLGNAEPMVPFDTIKNLLKSCGDIAKINTFGKIDIYKLNDNYYLPHIYIPKNTGALPEVLNSNNYRLRSVIYFKNQISSFDNIFSDDKNPPYSLEYNKVPKITFVKINPTKYKIKVENAKEPYLLVFSESFHKDWKLYVNSGSDDKNFGKIVESYFDGDIKEGTHRNIFFELATFETWNKKALNENRHLIANGFANSWYITPEDIGNKEDYELIIEFWPQRLVYMGLLISIITLIASSLYLTIDKARKNSKRA